MTGAAPTPADYLAKAADARRRADQAGHHAELYGRLMQGAIAYTLAAIAEWMAPAPLPQVPSLPAGYQIETAQAGTGERRWQFRLTCPDGGQRVSRHLWTSSEAALGEGIRLAATDWAGTHPDGHDGGSPASRG